ncbi:acyltransferase [Actinomycetes bacterium KLBMP 9797]
MTPPPHPIRLPMLAGIRVLPALLVFVGHAGMQGVFANGTVNFLILGLTAGAGEAALSMFFMLSGFVLAWSARPGDRTGRFYRRRLVKIFPNHLVVWTACVVLLIATGGALTAGQALPSLLLVQAWVPSIPVLSGVNGPSWSLSCELALYLLFPWLVRLVARIRPERLWWWVFGLGAAIAALPWLALLLPYEPTLFGLPVPFYRFWFAVFFPPVRVLDFAIGIVLARIVAEGRWPEVRPRVTLAILAVCWVGALPLPVPFNFVGPFVVPVVLLLGTAAAWDATGRRSWLSSPLMVRLGDLSFPFYLLHWPVLHYGHMAFGAGKWSPPVALAFLLAALLATVGLSWLLSTLVERPALRRWSEPRAAPRRPATVPA